MEVTIWAASAPCALGKPPRVMTSAPSRATAPPCRDISLSLSLSLSIVLSLSFSQQGVCLMSPWVLSKQKTPLPLSGNKQTRRCYAYTTHGNTSSENTNTYTTTKYNIIHINYYNHQNIYLVVYIDIYIYI